MRTLVHNDAVLSINMYFLPYLENIKTLVALTEFIRVVLVKSQHRTRSPSLFWQTQGSYHGC